MPINLFLFLLDGSDKQTCSFILPRCSLEFWRLSPPFSIFLLLPLPTRPSRKVTEFSSLQILQSGCNPRHLNSRAFLDCSGLHLDYMDYKVIKWIAEQYNPKQSKGNLCNPSAIHCNLGLQFCFAIQINLCNLTAIQEDCSLIAEIAVALLRLQRFSNLHIRLVILPRVGEVA